MNRGMTRRERQITDLSEILKILDKCRILHLGLVDGDEPYVVPMNYGYTYLNNKLTLYLHCATQGRKLDVIKQNPKVFFTMECDVEPFSGKMPCQYGTLYSSVMGKGVARIIEEPREKMRGLSNFMKTQTGIDFEFNERLVSAVTVIEIDVTDFTAKRRPKPSENIDNA